MYLLTVVMAKSLYYGGKNLDPLEVQFLCYTHQLSECLIVKLESDFF